MKWWLTLVSMGILCGYGFLYGQQPAVYPGSLHLRLNNGDSSYLRIVRFGLDFEDANARIVFSGNDTVFRYDIFPLQKIEVEECFISGYMHSSAYGNVFCNGFQSWSESREFHQEEVQRPLSKIMMPYARYYGDYTFYHYAGQPGVLRSWTYTYVRRNEGRIEMLASLDEDPGYTLIRFYHSRQSFRIERDCQGKVLDTGSYTLLHIFHKEGKESEIFDEWSSLYHPQEQSIPPGRATGWTSWYHYYDRINEKIIHTNLQHFDTLAIDFFQVDDGYQRSVGEWTQTNRKFPHGLKVLADSIHASGKKAGLWIAPFVCERNSPLVKQHPDWLLHDENGKLLKAGYNPGWSGWYYAFDIYHPGFRVYLEAQMDTLLHVYGFDLIKADFLFAAGIQHRNGKTRGEIMADAMAWLRAMTRGKLLLGCGVPLAPAFKRVDYCRIGNDIHTAWEFRLLRKLGASERPSTLSSLTNTIARRQLNGRFFTNDPDVYILRRKKNKLHPHQRFTNFIVNQLFGGLLFTSDDISQYDATTLALYRRGLHTPPPQITAIYPAGSGNAYLVTGMYGDCPVHTLINLDNRQREIQFSVPMTGMFTDPDTDFFSSSLPPSTESTISSLQLQPFVSFQFIPLHSDAEREKFQPCRSNLLVMPLSK